MKKHLHGTHLVFVLMALLFSSCATNLTLVENGEPKATIVMSQKPTRAAQFAADELNWHIKRITGTALPVAKDGDPVQGTRILVGESEATKALGLKSSDFKAQEYLIHFAPDSIALIGRDEADFETVIYDENDPFAFRTWPDRFSEQATMYATYDFLEKYCGVRWFRPGEIGISCPQTKNLEVGGEDIRRELFFKYRDIGFPNEEAYDAGATGIWSKKDVSKLFEMDRLAYPNLQRWGYLSWNYIHAKRGDVRLFLRRMRMGGEKYACNHSFYGYYNRFWKKSADPKLAELFVGKKEKWFAQGYPDIDPPPQMCFTNDEFIGQVVQDARDYFDGKGSKPGAQAAGDYFALVPMDNSSYCKCEKCQALFNKSQSENDMFSNGKWSDLVFSFANKVAKEVAKTHPDKTLSTLAYACYAYPPTREKLEPNISVGFCLHVRNIWSEPIQKNDIDLFDSWVQKYPGWKYFLFLYYCFPFENSRYGDSWYCFPGFFAHGIDKWFKIFHNAGVRGAYFCGFGQDVENYITFKLMDDPSQDVDKLLDEYFNGMFGAAAGPMKQLYLEIEKIYSSPGSYPHEFKGHQTEDVAWNSLGTEERMDFLGPLMDQAEQAAGSDIEKARVAHFKTSIWDCMVAGKKRHSIKKWLTENKAPAPLVVPRLAAEVANDDPAKADFSNAPVISKWLTETGENLDRHEELRMVHDGKNLFMQISQTAGEGKTLPATEEGSQWEIISARKPEMPYFKTILQTDAECKTETHGSNLKWDTGAKAVKGEWTDKKHVILVSIPLGKILPDGVIGGCHFYGNIIHLYPDGKHSVWFPSVLDSEVAQRFGTISLEAGAGDTDAYVVKAPVGKPSQNSKPPESIKIADNASVQYLEETELSMSKNDALQGQPLQLDTEGSYFFHRGQYSPKNCLAMTDATTGRSPTEDMFAQGRPECTLFWELPQNTTGKLKELKLWWDMGDSARNGANVKFSVRDSKTGEWREITPYLTVPPKPSAPNTYALLTVSFEGKDIGGFNAIRLHDGRGLLKSPNTRFVELDMEIE